MVGFLLSLHTTLSFCNLLSTTQSGSPLSLPLLHGQLFPLPLLPQPHKAVPSKREALLQLLWLAGPSAKVQAPVSVTLLKFSSSSVRVSVELSPESKSLQPSVMSLRQANVWETHIYGLEFITFWLNKHP
jgi:hypothetical protein